MIHTAKKPEPEIPERVSVPDYAHLLPEEIQPFTSTIQDAEHLSFIQGAGHGGSHPHLVNEFVSALRRGPRSLAQRRHQRQLDLRRHLRPPVGAAGRRDCAIAWVYVAG